MSPMGKSGNEWRYSENRGLVHFRHKSQRELDWHCAKIISGPTPGLVSTESLAHILQVCPRTHASRIALHDKIIDLVEQALTRKSYTTFCKPAISTPAGIRKPYLVVSRGSAVTLLDVTVVADNADLALSHGRKCKYYDTPAVCEWVQDRYSAVALNWRGSMAIPSARGLQSLGVSGVLLGRRSWIVNHFHRSAYKVRQYDGV